MEIVWYKMMVHPGVWTWLKWVQLMNFGQMDCRDVICRPHPERSAETRGHDGPPPPHNGTSQVLAAQGQTSIPTRPFRQQLDHRPWQSFLPSDMHAKIAEVVLFTG